MQYYKRITILILLFGIISCKKDFLDNPDKTTLLRQAYVTDLKTTGEFLNGSYVELAIRIYGIVGTTYPEIIADNIRPRSTSPLLKSQYTWQQEASDARSTVLAPTGRNCNGIWLSGYKIARETSFVIETVDKYRDENPALADNIKGQAYALRAYIHYVLVTMFAQPYSFTAEGSHLGVPYVATSDWAEPVSRQTVSEVYDGMISDLKNAVLLLPITQSTSDPRFTKSLFNQYAAKALLARIYLFRGDYQDAKNLAREVSVGIPLMTGSDYPSKLFTAQETEALFQLPASAGSSVAGSAGDYTVNYAGFYYGPAIRQLIATSDIASILNENSQDVRKQWVVPNGSEWDIRKFSNGLISSSTGSYYQTLLRSSEMYLTASEAYANLNNEDSARFYLDAIRLRADATAALTTATGTALVDSIYKERRKELAFEGIRMFDLLRWKQAVNRIDAPNPLAQNLPYPSEKAIAPIPVPDVTLAGLQQNPGY